MAAMQSLIFKFIKFGVVGFSGVFVDFGITYLLKEKLKVNKYVANSTGFICAVISNYYLNRIWTFRDNSPDVFIQFAKFLFISVIGLALNNLIIYLLNDKRNVNFYVSKIFAIVAVTVWNFIMNYFYTFTASA